MPHSIMSISTWNKNAKAYSKLASSKASDWYEHDINIPSILSLINTKPSIVLDLGCGSGEFTYHLSNVFKSSAILEGWDGAPNMIKIASETYPDIGFKVKDLEDKFAVRKKFDLITCKMLLMFIDNIDNLAKETYAVTERNGILIISVTHPVYQFTNYLQDKYNYKERPEFRVLEGGYFAENKVKHSVAGIKDLTFNFKHRTISSYINPFLKAGFILEEIDEPKVTKNYLKKHPEISKDKEEVPMRLNLRFRRL
jgi:SAM-dependent methyltransferase